MQVSTDGQRGVDNADAPLRVRGVDVADAPLRVRSVDVAVALLRVIRDAATSGKAEISKAMFRRLVPRHQAKVAATTWTKKTAAATARQKTTPQRLW